MDPGLLSVARDDCADLTRWSRELARSETKAGWLGWGRRGTAGVAIPMALGFEGVTQRFGAVTALSDVSLTVRPGEIVALLGQSGCGKTTLLRLAAGVERPSSGRVLLEGRDVSDPGDFVEPEHRGVGFVFQDYALFPHLTVGENVRFGLRGQGAAAAEATALRALARVGLADFYGAYPHMLSGGEQQRVALARALVSRPGVLLLDEPMSALDAKLKKSLQAELKKLHREIGTSFVLVTHDLEEAMMLADRICVMRGGHVVQVGTPADIYYRPANMFVAGFIGETNFLPVTATAAGGGMEVASPLVAAGQTIIAPEHVSPSLSAKGTALLVRPETIRFVKGDAAPGEWLLDGQVEEYFIKGASTQYRIRVRGLDAAVIMDLPGSIVLPAVVGEAVRIGFDPVQAFLLSE